MVHTTYDSMGSKTQARDTQETTPMPYSLPIKAHQGQQKIIATDNMAPLPFQAIQDTAQTTVSGELFGNRTASSSIMGGLPA